MPYTVDPDFCDLTVSCNSVSTITNSTGIECQNLTANALTLSFDSTDYSGGLTPGTYTFNFTVSTTGASDPALTPTFTFDIELKDPCDPPTSLEVTDPKNDITYTVTEKKKLISMAPRFTITPSFCKFNVVPTFSTLPGGQEPIDIKDEEVRVKYKDDLAIVGET